MTDRVTHLHHVGIVVQDLDKTVAWYERHLGFAKLSEYRFPGARVAFAGRGDLRLEFFQTDGAGPMVAEREQPATNLRIGGINHFALAVEDLERSLADLAAAGVEVVSGPADVGDGRGDRFAFVRDNERMLIELYQVSA